MTRSRSAAAPVLDGRIQRSERSREAIVGALLELVGRGILQPTAQQVADRAGVGIRSVFRHFSEMETLYAAMDARLEADVAPLVRGTRPAGSLDDRLRALVRDRVRLYERIAPFKRSANAQRWRSRFLNDRHLRMQRLLREDLLARVPEIAARPAELVESLDLALSFEAWDRLRADRRLGQRQAAAVVERTVLALAAGR